MTLTVIHAAFRDAVGDVRDGADRLRADRERLDREVDGFLGAGWTGVAAQAFASGWEDWKASAQDILDGLVAMGQLLDAAHQDFLQQDTASQAQLDRIAHRIVERLG